MGPERCAEREKKLRIEPVDDSRVCFHASLIDTSIDEAGNELIHSLRLSGVVSLPDLIIREIDAESVHQPYTACLESVAPMEGLVGLTIGPGYRSKVMALLGGVKCCSHFLTLALDLAATHTLITFLRMRAKIAFEGRHSPDGAWIGTGLKMEPRLENACIALTSESPVIVNAKRYLEATKASHEQAAETAPIRTRTDPARHRP